MTDTEQEAIGRAWTKHCETVTWPEESANHRKAFTAGYLACQRAASSDVEQVLSAFSLADARVGCGDNSCLFVKPGGMATNGGCRCTERPGVPAALAKLYKAVAELVRPSKQEGSG